MGAPDVLARLASVGISLSPLPDGRLWAEPSHRLTDDLRALIRTHRADLLTTITRQKSVEAQLVGLIAELADITEDFTDEDRREALEVAMNSQIGPEGWRDYLRDVLIPEQRRLH